MNDLYASFAPDQRMVLIYTLKCTAQCAHCITESTPKRTERLELEEARACIRAGHQDGKRLVIFSGGEVFLHYKDLLQLVAEAHGLDMHTMVETNSYWATNDTITRAKLSALKAAGLDTIHTSADSFRDPYVPLDRICRFGRIAAALDIPYDICFLYSGNDVRDQEILNTLDEQGLQYSTDTVFPFGNATALPSTSLVYTDFSDFGDCGDLQPTISGTGEVVACCNINIHKAGTPLHLGNLRHTSPEAMLRAHRDNPFVRAIQERGFRYFHQVLLEHAEEADGYEPRQHATICHYCHELFSNPKRVELFRRKLDESRSARTTEPSA